MLNIILFGPPGGGKGTQSEKLVDTYNLLHVSTGELLRKEIEEKTEMGIEAQKLIDKGFFAPDEMVIKLVDTAIKNNPHVKGVLLDGFPRTTAQCVALDELLKNYNSELTILISMEVSEEESIRRIVHRGLTSGRPDDAQVDIIKQRIISYHNKTVPVKTYYEKFAKVASVNGEGDVDTIFNELCNVIDKKLETVDAG